jgi:hypothetical protein
MWSKTAKKILGFHLFCNHSLTSAWEATLHQWWDEVNYIQNHHGSLPMLEARLELMEVFFNNVIKLLYSKGYLTSEEFKEMVDSMAVRSNHVLKPRNTFAQAIIIKAFFEASLNRNWRKKFDSLKRTSIYGDELFTMPLGSMLQGTVEDQFVLDKRISEEYQQKQ